jgi:hypothetical protein
MVETCVLKDFDPLHRKQLIAREVVVEALATASA